MFSLCNSNFWNLGDIFSITFNLRLFGRSMYQKALSANKENVAMLKAMYKNTRIIQIGLTLERKLQIVSKA